MFRPQAFSTSRRFAPLPVTQGRSIPATTSRVRAARPELLVPAVRRWPSSASPVPARPRVSTERGPDSSTVACRAKWAFARRFREPWPEAKEPTITAARTAQAKALRRSCSSRAICTRESANTYTAHRSSWRRFKKESGRHETCPQGRSYVSRGGVTPERNFERSSAMSRIPRILFASDFSPASRRA